MMTPTSDTDRRGGGRVAFDETVQVLPLGSQQTIWARAQNLSESGIFVSSSRLFGIGTAIGLRLPLPTGEGRISLRGRVVRVSGGARPGMGIAFEPLGEHESEALRRAVQQALPGGAPADSLRWGGATVRALPCWVREAKVWFAGTAQPTRVQARLGPEGLRLFCDLGFLRLGVPLTLFFPDDEARSYTGVLHAATLHTDSERGVPRLELSMALDQELPDDAETWTYWPPPPVTGASAGEPHRADAEEPTLIELTPVAATDPIDPGERTEEILIEAALRQSASAAPPSGLLSTRAPPGASPATCPGVCANSGSTRAPCPLPSRPSSRRCRPPIRCGPSRRRPPSRPSRPSNGTRAASLPVRRASGPFTPTRCRPCRAGVAGAGPASGCGSSRSAWPA